jgi:hypothetical protein
MIRNPFGTSDVCEREYRSPVLACGRPTQRAPDPRNSTGASVVGVCAFSGSLRGLEWILTK